MPSCPACGADVQHVTEDGTGERLVLETYTEMTGKRRYVTSAHGSGGAQAVGENVQVQAYPDHKLDCPAYGNGLS